MSDVTIKFRDGVITREEAASDVYVLAAPPPPEQSGDPVIYAFERETDELETWAGQHGFGDLLARAIADVQEAEAGAVDEYALVSEATTKSAKLEELADEMTTEGSADPETLIGEATRRGILETVTLFGGPFYQRPLTVLPGSIPNINWLAALVPQVQSIYSTLEVALVYDQPDYLPSQRPRAVVWPTTGIPFLGFPPRSIYVYG